MILTFDQIRRFFEHHHPGQRIGTRNKASVKCCFHDDSTASGTVFLDGNGGYHCNGCGASGNVFQFQAKIAGCSLADAEKQVAEITGATPDRGFLAEKLGPVVATYDYRDETGRVLYQKRRYQPERQAKTFRTYRPDGERWIASIDAEGVPTRRVLYNLPMLVTANVVAICEGEKDAENVMQAAPYAGNGDVRFVATCNFDGAWKPGDRPKWLPEYDAHFAGKLVFVFRDNDESGDVWSSHVAASAARYARQVRIVALDSLPEKGDVSDWLQTHSGDDLRKAMHASAKWEISKPAQTVFLDAVEFAAEVPAHVDWLVEGAITGGTNGIICGDPKASKSFHAVDLAMSLACGVDWLGMRVPRRIRTALVSREDSPSLTQRRINRLLCGNERYGLNLQSWMLVNTRRQMADFQVTSENNLQLLIDELKRFQVEFVVLDVFRSLHSSDENDNTEVQRVLQHINRIQNECECGVALVHHLNKVSSENIFKGLRGASAIHGWMEWGIGITVVNPEQEDKATYVRRLEFESKEATLPAIYTQIREGDSSTIRIERVAKPQEDRPARRVRDVLSMGANR